MKMRLTTTLSSLLALLPIPSSCTDWKPRFLAPFAPASVTGAQQAPIMPLPDIPLPAALEAHRQPGGPVVSDVLGRERSINVFAGFIRDADPVSRRLDARDKPSIVLAPLNSQLDQLPRKPWEDAQEYAALGEHAYAGSGGQDRAKANLRHFVQAHVVPASPWAEGERQRTLAGKEVWWETKDGKKLIQPGDVEVASVASKASNGELWIIKGIITSA